jgi:hypothetical protein
VKGKHDVDVSSVSRPSPPLLEPLVQPVRRKPVPAGSRSFQPDHYTYYPPARLFFATMATNTMTMMSGCYYDQMTIMSPSIGLKMMSLLRSPKKKKKPSGCSRNQSRG